MHDRFLQIIKKHALKGQNELNLLAISGGIDSMVLWHLVEASGEPYAVAHCNFQLRGEESNLDESFVKSRATSLGVKYHSIEFDTQSYATINKVSTQMAARELRYTWFDKLCNQYDYSRIVLAHHADDDVETVLLNMVRGTSIRGLAGMSEQSKKRFRPLLRFSKQEILTFAKENDISWREDKSNAEVHYKRNFVRKEIIPRLKTLNPDLLTTMRRNMAKNEEVHQLTVRTIAHLKKQLLTNEYEDQWKINKSDLLEHEVGPYVLSELLKDFGYNYHQSEEILKAMNGLAGKTFMTLTHELIVDRDSLQIRANFTNDIETVDIQKGERLVTDHFEYLATVLDNQGIKIDKTPVNAMFDLDMLSFPLVMRPWQEGDKFQPLGMIGQKLLSDLLVDNKLSVFAKDAVHVLCSSDEIIWVIGMRISDKFKITEDTKSVLHYRLKV